MAYKLRKNQSIEDSVRLVAYEQIKKAVGEIENSRLDRHETVHQVRKRCKKLRGLIRIVRPCFPDYRKENRFLRDMARGLSFVRDAQSMLESLDKLAGHYQPHVRKNVFAAVRCELVKYRGKVTEDTKLIDEKLVIFLSQLREILNRSERWRIQKDGYPALRGGIRKTYGRGRKAMIAAYDNPGAETFHEWRKRVKYHWYHLRLMRHIWPRMLEVQRNTADELADLLGDEHDLAVLRTTLHRTGDRFAGKQKMSLLMALIDRRRHELQVSARTLGERLFAEKEKNLGLRLGSYWSTWQATML